MAITKLMHMKEGIKTKHEHLQNAIRYILNPEKTKGGLLASGNSGTGTAEILENFLETKRVFEKMDGRQGYHFVISFAKGEADGRTAYEAVGEFCRQYLGDRYDYVYAVHDDKEHMHGHIIFNSVSRADGYKYHYKKGDWKKDIQPVTDRICKEHGLSALTFTEERVGTSYASWQAKEENGFNRKDIFRADIDFAVCRASSFEDFLDILKRMGYEFNRAGKHGKGEEYMSLRIRGMKNYRRTSALGEGYSIEDIKERILSKEGRSYLDLTEKMCVKAGEFLKPEFTGRSLRTYTRLYQAVSYYRLPNPYAVPAYRVRKDMADLHRLCEECAYLKRNRIKGIAELTERRGQIEKEMETLRIERRTAYRLQGDMSPEQLEAAKQCSMLKRELEQAYKTGDDRFEEIEDRLKELQGSYPEGFLGVPDKIEGCRAGLSALRAEKKMIDRLLRNEADARPKIEKEKIL